ncbi:hypothetical protein BH23BAC1_BH23BAC1_27030 [soil metagenome]
MTSISKKYIVKFIKNGIFILLIISAVSACSPKDPSSHDDSRDNQISGTYGEQFQEENPIQITLIQEALENKDSLYIQAQGKIEKVCQKKGCWMQVGLGNGETMMVTFKDYGFFVPADIEGKSVVFEGVAKKEITSVETLRHYAEDAGKSPQEINAITEPEESIVFEAVGVKVLN